MEAFFLKFINFQNVNSFKIRQRNFLHNHELSNKVRPYVSKSCNPEKLKKDAPDVYRNMIRRLEYADDELDALNAFFITKYKELIVGTKNIEGRMQRLEDLTDFVIEEYTANGM